MIGGIVSGVAGLAGSYLQYKGQKDANRQNLQEAQRNREFQERMSNTAYQRQTEDLEKAGLNRILGYSKGAGASSPAGSQAQLKSAAEGMAANLSNTAKDTVFKSRQVKAQLGILQEQAEKLKAESVSAKNDAVASSARSRAEVSEADVRTLKANLYKQHPELIWINEGADLFNKVLGGGAAGTAKDVGRAIKNRNKDTIKFKGKRYNKYTGEY